MTEYVSMRVDGLSQSEKALVNLGAKLGYGILSRSARKALKPMLEEAKRRAPYDSNTQDGIHLRDDIRIVVRKGGNDGSNRAMTAMIKTGRKTRKYAAMIEFGRHEFMQKRYSVYGFKTKRSFKVKVRKTLAQPFLRPAYHQERENTVRLFAKYLREDLRRTLKRRAKKRK